MKSLEFFQVDAFTDTAFAGNPAAVFVLDGPANEDWMRQVAREMNLSETAFLHPTGKRAGDFHLRWFTPAVEVDLCGHATLASAHVLWQTGALARSQNPTFQTRSGELGARRVEDRIELDFPATPLTEPADAETLRSALSAALHVSPRSILRAKFDVLVELDSESAVRSLQPDFGRLADCDAARGVIVTARADAGSRFDFVSRFFAPRAGVNEDPVTGSAHCALAPFWSRKLGKTDMLAHQISARGGVMRVIDNSPRVLLQGNAITVFRGEMLDSAQRAG